MVPSSVTNIDTRLSVDNYLSDWFIRFLPGVTPRQAKLWERVPRDERFNPANNYLWRNRSLIPVWAAPFLLNDGWNLGQISQVNIVNFPSNVSEFVGRRLHYIPWGGSESSDWTEVWPQLFNFINMVDELEIAQMNATGSTKGKFPGDSGNNDFDAMVRTLREVRIMANRLTDMAYYYNRALRQMTITPVALMNEEHFKNDFKHARIGIPMGSLFSMVMLLDAESIDVMDFGKDFYRFGRNMNNAFNILTENYYYSVDAMPKTKDKPFYTKSEILENALSLTPASSINDLMRKTFGVKPNSHDVVWPIRSVFGYDTSAFKRKLGLARDFVESRRNMFNVANSFYYAPGALRSNRFNSIFKEYFVLPDDVAANPTQVLEWLDIIRLFQNDEMTELLRDARRNRKIIKFNVPIKTVFTHGNPNTNEAIAPINFSKDMKTPISLTNLPIYFRDQEEFLRRELNRNATLEDPDWVVAESDIPRILEVESNPSLLINAGFELPVEGYKVIDEIEEMVFVARNV
jgi:hypothetical protein